MASFIVNALQVNFESVLSMEDAGMVRMFRSLEQSGLRGFLGVSGSVFEGTLTQFFANASMIVGTVVNTAANRNMVITMDVFAEAFHLPIEGMVSFSGLSAKEMVEMKALFSTSEAPFKPSNKKNDMKEEQQAPEAGQAGPIPSSPSNSSFSVHYSDSVGNTEDRQGPSSSGLQLVQYRYQRDYTEEEQDFAQADPQPINFSSTPVDFDAVAKLKKVNRPVTSLESTVYMMRDDQKYMKYDSNIFRRALYKKMDEVATSVNTSQTALETNIVRQFIKIQQHFSSAMDFVKLQLA
ncbi:hypothetical protein F511_21147 [Dorcoceras hygrometricum]|uniref:Uncharacterized protein n=1 Tax=Dorcoceras hygrometricum TaxID=472368 RepID=A0A2Z7A8K0_9LAMI|nr:hypothetical protein F511_21147 [Dorcoceras hygrometricum]